VDLSSIVRAAMSRRDPEQTFAPNAMRAYFYSLNGRRLSRGDYDRAAPSAPIAG